MERRAFLAGAAALFAAPRAAEAQPAAKPPRIAYIGGTPFTSGNRAWGAFVQGLLQLGWVEGQNIIIEQDHYPRFIEFAQTHRIPTAGLSRRFVQAGGLLYFGADAADLYGRAAIYVDRILKGAKPADLPMEQPTKFELVINLKTAKALGLTIPRSLLLQADQVIE